MTTVTAPDGRKAKLMTNGIVRVNLRKCGKLVAQTDTHEFYDGRNGLVVILREVQS